MWTREKNAFGWQSVLGDTAPDEVSPFVSPARATDLAGLPTTYVDAGSAEVFRDEDVNFASRIWEAGGQAELHLWAGGFHGFDAMFPDANSLAGRARRPHRLAGPHPTSVRLISVAGPAARHSLNHQGYRHEHHYDHRRLLRLRP